MKIFNARQVTYTTYVTQSLKNAQALRKILSIGEVVEIKYDGLQDKYYAIYHVTRGFFQDTWGKINEPQA